MGWSIYSAASSPQNKEQEYDEIRRLCTWDGDKATNTLVDAKKVGSTWYAAMRITPKDETHTDSQYIADDDGSFVIAVVFLTSRERGEWGYKDMSESMGPCYYDCPASILALLSPLTGEGYAKEWRAKCEETRKAKRAKVTPGSLPHGATVTLQEPLSFQGGVKEQTFTVQKRAGYKREKTLFQTSDGWLCRLTSRHLEGATITPA